MSQERDVTRLVRSWIREDQHESADRILGMVLDRLDTTPQRRSWWPGRRSNRMNTYAKLIVAAAAVLVVAFAGFQLLPRSGGVGGEPTIAQSPSPTLLASGNFHLKGAAVELDATRDGSDVTGVMTVDDSGPHFTADLECTRTTPGGMIIIGGVARDSTSDYAPDGTRVAITLKPGSPMTGTFHFENPDPPAATCLEFIESVTDAMQAPVQDPIEGNIELRP
ncbi:MAG TPA: hypothetical protein VFU17_01080 [Candidatus Limnocylindrales bacterium]|nr:hypothetical protein [Candidatus Limnocylindrales bacterium]